MVVSEKVICADGGESLKAGNCLRRGSIAAKIGRVAALVLCGLCLESGAVIRYDYSIDGRRHGIPLFTGLHCDFMTVSTNGESRLLWCPSADCLIVGKEPETNRIWGVLTEARLENIARQNGRLRYAIRISPNWVNSGAAEGRRQEDGTIKYSDKYMVGVTEVLNVIPSPECDDVSRSFVGRALAAIRLPGKVNPMLLSSVTGCSLTPLARYYKYALFALGDGRFAFACSFDEGDVAYFAFKVSDGMLTSLKAKPYRDWEKFCFDNNSSVSARASYWGDGTVSLFVEGKATIDVSISLDNLKSIDEWSKDVGGDNSPQWTRNHNEKHTNCMF